jgi:Leucine-rich repeat (LRR) protein
MFYREDLCLEKLERVRDEIKYCDESRHLMLGHCGLKAFPTHIFDNEKVNTIYRLDLSHNWISDIPASIGDLVGLKELWLFNNAPLSSLPVDMQNLIHLEVLDIRNTNISEIPKEFANLTKLNEMDWRDTPLEKNLQQQYGVAVNDVFALKELLVALNERNILEVTLHEHLMGEHFLMDADNPHLKSAVDMLVEDISRAFDDLKDLKLFMKRAEKLLPPSINQLKQNTVSNAKDLFYEMRRDSDRQRMAADVEIKVPCYHYHYYYYHHYYYYYFHYYHYYYYYQ